MPSKQSGALKPSELKIKDAAEVIAAAPREIPVMLWSDTGTGKTEIVGQIRHPRVAVARLACHGLVAHCDQFDRHVGH